MRIQPEPERGQTSGAQLAFFDSRYTIPVTLSGKPTTPLSRMLISTVERQLLHGITAEVSSGHVLAILGPSGAGKTTLLNMLTLQRRGGKPFARVLLNGKTFTQSMYRTYSAYVEQDDSLWATLTAQEHLSYAIRLYRPQLSSTEIAVVRDTLLQSVGLKEVEHIKAGNAFMHGLSSGHKRRLSIAIALSKQPHLLFLDEPTSGVDSASAALMMTLLKKVAVDNQVAILCTIHQPSASVWAGFDNALILSMGRTAYCGPAAKLGDYCASLGKPVPELANPAEFFLNLVNAPPPSTVPFACVHTHPPTPPPSLSRPPSSLSPSTLNLAQR